MEHKHIWVQNRFANYCKVEGCAYIQDKRTGETYDLVTGLDGKTEPIQNTLQKVMNT